MIQGRKLKFWRICYFRIKGIAHIQCGSASRERALILYKYMIFNELFYFCAMRFRVAAAALTPHLNRATMRDAILP
jgi:hypothetical protein